MSHNEKHYVMSLIQTVRLHPGRWAFTNHGLSPELKTGVVQSAAATKTIRRTGGTEWSLTKMHHKLFKLTVKPKRNTQHQTDTDEYLYLLNNNTKPHINTWPLSTSKCCLHISNIQQSEHNYIWTNQSELFSNRFFATFPLYAPTQFGPMNTSHNTFTVSLKRKKGII